ncbi:MAG: gluconate 2-dehydrogenase subunit 3 family protein [Dehalococcoidia bacterium]
MTSPAASGPTFFEEQQRLLMTCILDRLIPPGGDGEFPGAGELGIIDHLDQVVARSGRLKRLFSQGITRIKIAAEAENSDGFVELPQDRQVEVLRRVESEEPAFFDALVRHTYNGYYTNPEIIQLLGLEPGPPQPSGYLLEAGDLSGLEKVKQRGQVYRDISDEDVL